MLWNEGEERREPTKIERERKEKNNNVTGIKWNNIEREKQTYKKGKNQTGVWVEGQVELGVR